MGFLPKEDRTRHPTYWAICQGIASDPALLAMAARVPPPQLAVNVFLASVHHLLLEGADHVLATHYRSVCARRGSAFRVASHDELVAAFTSFCHAYDEPITERCATRATQTNEVGRCSILRAVLGGLAARGESLVSLVDLGTSAGLNLFVDAYRYDYSGTAVGDPDATPLLTCELRGELPPLGLPAIAARVGVDLSPVDPRDDDEVSWLLACLWPDDLARFSRLDAAVAVAARRSDELEILAGDMLDALGAAIDRCHPDSHVLVANCWSAAYLTPPRRATLTAELRRLANRRPLTWVTMEAPAVSRDLGVLDKRAALSRRDVSVVCVTSFDDALTSSVLVAECHAHGAWLDWSPRSLWPGP
jgi:hypothetical protein